MRGPNTQAIEQARYCADMAERLAGRVASCEGKRSSLGTIPGEGYFGMNQMNCPENITRMITQLRAELLELRRLFEKGNKL